MSLSFFFVKPNSEFPSTNTLPEGTATVSIASFLVPVFSLTQDGTSSFPLDPLDGRCDCFFFHGLCRSTGRSASVSTTAVTTLCGYHTD